MDFRPEEVTLRRAVCKFLISSKSKVKLTGLSPEQVALFLELGNLGLMLCGGSVLSVMTGKAINDLDFYIRDSSQVAGAQQFFEKIFGKPVFKSTNAITYKRKDEDGTEYCVQLIIKFTGPPAKIFSTFDFTITEAAYDFRHGVFEFGDRFHQDVAKKRLVYLGGSRFPICALYRTKKYQDKGYYLPGSTLMHIALSIVQLEIKTYADLKEQLMGIDTMYLQNLLSFRGSTKADTPVDYGKFLKEAFDYLNGYRDVEEADADHSS